jgi:uncharacterized membrane protein
MEKIIKSRFWELDLLRGIAIILMIILHLAYDLYYFEVSELNIYESYLIYFVISGFSLFYLLVGISLTLSYSKMKLNHKSDKDVIKTNLSRGLQIFCWGLLITCITYIFMRDGFVLFGALHLIGLSIIIAYPFLKQTRWNIIFGAVIISIGLVLRGFRFDFPWLVWLGLRPHGFYTVDYFPLLPYFGIVLIGIALGNIFYQNYKRRFYLVDLSKYQTVRFFGFLGRHSLLIYLVHQPILLLILMCFGIIDLGVL